MIYLLVLVVVLAAALLAYGAGGLLHLQGTPLIVLDGANAGSSTTGLAVIVVYAIGGWQPMTDLFLTMMDGLGVEQEKLGDSTGRFNLV